MRLYRVLLRGENFLLNFTGDPELLGFHVTHYVRARDETDAQRIATILVRKNQQLNTALTNTREKVSRLECEAVKRVWWPRSSKNGRYDFWPMDEGE